MNERWWRFHFAVSSMNVFFFSFFYFSILVILQHFHLILTFTFMIRSISVSFRLFCACFWFAVVVQIVGSLRCAHRFSWPRMCWLDGEERKRTTDDFDLCALASFFQWYWLVFVLVPRGRNSEMYFFVELETHNWSFREKFPKTLELPDCGDADLWAKNKFWIEEIRWIDGIIKIVFPVYWNFHKKLFKLHLQLKWFSLEIADKRSK